MNYKNITLPLTNAGSSPTEIIESYLSLVASCSEAATSMGEKSLNGQDLEVLSRAVLASIENSGYKITKHDRYKNSPY